MTCNRGRRDHSIVATFRIRRHGRALRRRYVLTEIASDGKVNWEWEPLSRWTINRCLLKAGWHTTDIADHLHWADEEHRAARRARLSGRLRDSLAWKQHPLGRQHGTHTLPFPGRDPAHRWLANAEADHGRAILRRRAGADQLGAGAAAARE
jgi:hypothetical protein